MNIKAIVLNTFKEAVRNKIFYLFIFFGIFFAATSRFISLLTIGDRIKVMKDIGLASIDFFCVLIVIFTGINLVYKEIERKTIYTILSKPIQRWQFILGKFLGLALTAIAALVTMATIFIFYMLVFTGEFDLGIFLYLFMFYLELLVLISISLLFSSFSTPILSSIFAICIFLIGQFIWTFNEFKHLLPKGFIKYLSYAIYYLLPNFYKFNIKNAVVLKMPIPLSDIFLNIFYALLYIGIILSMTVIIFRKREFN